MTTIPVGGWEQAGGGFVRLVIPSGCLEPEESGPDFSNHRVLGPAELGDPPIMGELVCRKRPPVIGRLERHLRTSEILVALDGDVVVPVAAPEVDPARCAPGDVRALPLRRGQALWLDRGAWHLLPFPVRAEQVTLLLLFREGTAGHDLEFRDLGQPIGIALEG